MRMSVVLTDAIVGERDGLALFPATVTVTRTSEEDFKSRQLNVWLDGARAATLLWGDSITIDVDPGPHRVRVSNTLVWKTIDFQVEPAQQLFFEVVNRIGAGTISMMMLLGVAPLYLTVRRMDL